MDPHPHYWTFNLSPYLFQLKDLSFQWVFTWWGCLLLTTVFAGGYLFSRISNVSKIKKELMQTFLLYAFGILVVLFLLNHFHVKWGLRWYSTMYLIGFVVVYLSCVYWIKKKTLRINEPMLASLIASCIVGMLVGARIAYVFIYNWEDYKEHPFEVFATWNGGLSFHGAVVGVGVVLLLFCKKNKVSFFHVTDKMVRVVPIGIGLGRIGNFMNGELWGRQISSPVPWAVIFPDGGPVARHPSQIYQSLAEGWGLFLTLFVLSRWKHREGILSICFILFYSLYRFFVEYFRAADIQVSYFYLNHFKWAPLNAYADSKWWQIVTMGQILCFIFVIISFFLLKFIPKNKKG